MKFCYLLPVLCFMYFTSYSQVQPHRCFGSEHPIFELPDGVGKYLKAEKSITKLQTVVHVIYDDNQDDLPDGAVEEIMQKVNEDFRRQNADTINTPDAFKPFAVDTEIEFELASVDPSGGPTNGITHTKVPFDLSEGNASYKIRFDSLGGKSAWNNFKYVNIWLVQESLFFTSVVSLPSLSSHGTPQDGVAVGYHPFSSDYRNLVHFLGHYLGLLHPFLYEYEQLPTDTCSVLPGGPDRLEDTPNQLYSIQPFGLCPDFPYIDICSPDTPGVMYMNYMAYTPSECKNMFTRDQAAAMNWVLDSIRSSLLEPVTSVEENGSYENMEVHFYPNPVKEKLIIEFRNPTAAKKEYHLFDSMGKVMERGVLQESAKNEMDIAHLPSGIYFLKIRSRQLTYVYKIMKM